MAPRYLRPGWVIAHLIVLALAVVFVMLGLWQLDRLEERRDQNALGASRFGEAPVDPFDVLTLQPGSLEYRRLVVEGVFDPSGEVLIRSQVYLGNAGFHVITPLVVGERGEAVLVNRGWVPLGMDHPPVADASPPTGNVEIEGWVHLTQERPPLGPEDPPEGTLDQMSRVDVARIANQLPYRVPLLYLVQLGEQSADLPVRVDEPVFDDEGPHLAYAIQWFGFALVLVVGWVFFARRQMRTSSQEPSGARASPSTISKPSSSAN